MSRERLGSGRPAALTVRAPAKVNLFLEVTARRPDGYHDLRTLIVAVSLFDALAFAPAATVRLSCTDPTLGAGPENLVVRAAELLRRHTGTTAGVAVRLTKRIPVQAGLGGGSSDAAATLVGLNRLWKLGLAREELTKLAAELGSDVAFFVDRVARPESSKGVAERNKTRPSKTQGVPPGAWCTGRGEVVTPWPLGTRLHFVLVCPPFGLSTAEVYREVAVPAAPKTGAGLKQAVRAGDVAAIGRRLHNRLQSAALAVRPELGDWLDRLARRSPVATLVSGSGSTVFALARDAADARRIAAAVRPEARKAGGRVFVVRSLV